MLARIPDLIVVVVIALGVGIAATCVGVLIWLISRAI